MTREAFLAAVRSQEEANYIAGRAAQLLESGDVTNEQVARALATAEWNQKQAQEAAKRDMQAQQSTQMLDDHSKQFVERMMARFAERYPDVKTATDYEARLVGEQGYTPLEAHQLSVIQELEKKLAAMEKNASNKGKAVGGAQTDAAEQSKTMADAILDW